MERHKKDHFWGRTILKQTLFVLFLQETKQNQGETNIDEAHIAENLPEQEILIQSVCETLVPKLVAEDIPLLFSLLSDVFPNVSYTRAEMSGLKEEIRKVCAEEYLVCGEGDEQGTHWMEKVKTTKRFSTFIKIHTNSVRINFFIMKLKQCLNSMEIPQFK